ncbi:cobalamin-5'-phosphate synthase [Chitinophaga polysaccharea]|uniref:Adenosylcobinamide-GDP ribazoletransferase n=1 Tax=Chitinophaga polysaccharea TaxID=1293035 RepID=A0A561PB78_9BACT|nr:adenosylcobinamide-GDP ribazoletransferase [Chitinophaga polysaccharea]TWF35310.1 cobalamin-5'-phosphate synthase [Chitinophaga polysaccharea]
MIKKELRIFFTALMFYTRIPCPKWVDHSASYLNQSTRYFPLIGWIVGLLCFAVYYGVSCLFPADISVIISMVTGIFVTGAFHEDGFADVCDGFGGGWTKQKILDIMKDSRVGAFGVIGLILLFLLKFTLLLHIAQNGNIAPATLLALFIAAHSLSRLAAISIVFTHQYARESDSSKIKPVAEKYTWKEISGAFFFGLAPLIYLALYHYQIMYALIPVFIFRFLLARYFDKWIGGYTGDCLGATQQVGEIVFYLSVIGIWKFI